MSRKVLVEDYMVRGVVSVEPHRTVKEATDKLISTEFHGLPVAEEDGKLFGFITAKQLLRSALEPDSRIRDIIPKGTITVSPHMTIDDAARIIFRYGLRNLPVVDEDGRLVGIISNIDIVRSHIEKATPNKVNMVKNFLESKHSVRIKVRRGLVPIAALKPTQHEIYADELRGRQHEIKRGLVEPIITIQKNQHFLLVDGHHRVLAAMKMGVKQFSAFILEPEREIELGMEKSAEERGLKELEDVKILEGSRHPLVEITTRLMRE
ncbi:MAG: CBS domain-containing ParB/RepB/Spo0J family partition protein [Methanomassiliicoccales archaeon]